jgi:Protein of unknown function (DUF3014)
MLDDDLEFERPTDELEPPPPPDRGPIRRIVAGLVALAVVGALVAYFVLRLRPAPSATPPTPTPIDSGSPQATADPTLPGLDQSDGFVRTLARGLSADPLVASWLAAEDLIRRFVAVVVNVAQGTNPSPHLGFLAPRQGFHAVQRKGRFVIDPDSYARFDGFATAVASVDVAEAARVYRKLRPLFDAAGRELELQPGTVDGLVQQAIANLVATPIADGDVPVALTPPFYRFADPKLERLAPAQKQLLRMGPRNARAIQAKLRTIGDALSASPPP